MSEDITCQYALSFETVYACPLRTNEPFGAVDNIIAVDTFHLEFVQNAPFPIDVCVAVMEFVVLTRV